DQPLLTVGQPARRFTASMAEAHELDERVGLAREPRLLGAKTAAGQHHVENARRPPEVEADHHVVGDALRGEDARALEGADDPARSGSGSAVKMKAPTRSPASVPLPQATTMITIVTV